MFKGRNFETHNFYCMHCGKKNIVLFRSRGHLKKKNHRKVLYCPYCQNTVNHIECKTKDDEIEFIEAFNQGLYKEEAEQSINFVKQQRVII